MRTSIRRYLAPAGLGLGLSAVVLLARLSGVWETAGAGEAAAPESSSLAPVALPAYDAPVSAPVVRRLALPHTEVPERPRVSVLRYSVQLGDTAWSIADQFGLKPETLLWGNEGLSSEAGSLQIGRELNILPVDGVLHTVKEGETLESLQAFYDVPAEAILEFPGNGLASHAAVELLPGQELIIPGATKAVAWVEPGPRVLAGQGRRSPGFYSGPLVYLGTGYFQWPVSPVRITQSYWSGHPAIDLDTYFRQPVFASDSGTVIYSKWDTTGYGNLIIVDHGNGLWTYYAHNEANLVRPGDGVLQGQQIAESGSTGNSTGEHLDFRIRLAEGGFLNPLDYLP